MEQYIRSYLKYLTSEKNLTENSIVSYTRDLGDFTAFLKDRLNQDTLDPRDISKTMVRAYMTALQQDGKSKKTVARRLAALRSFFKYLCREKIVDVNVATNLVTPKLDRRLPSFLDLTETFGVMDLPSEKSFSGIRDRAVLELFYSTGMRLSELVGLNLDSLNRHDHAVRVLGKGRKERIIPYGSKAAEALGGYLQARRALLQKKGPGARTDDEALFLNMHGRRITGRAIQYMVKKYLSKVSEKNKLSPHILRHTFATHLLDKGADLRAVKELLGHESLSTTQIYTHVTTEKLKKIYDQAHPRA